MNTIFIFIPQLKLLCSHVSILRSTSPFALDMLHQVLEIEEFLVLFFEISQFYSQLQGFAVHQAVLSAI